MSDLAGSIIHVRSGHDVRRSVDPILSYVIRTEREDLALTLDRTIFDEVKLPSSKGGRFLELLLEFAIAMASDYASNYERRFGVTKSHAKSNMPIGDDLPEALRVLLDFSKPPAGSGDILKRAKKGDASAVAELNRIAPGVIYAVPEIRAELQRQTRIALQGPVPHRKKGDPPQVIKQARDWLRVVCMPVGPREEGGAIISRIHFMFFPRVYFDVVKLRAVVSRHLEAEHRSRAVEADAIWLSAMFPRASLSEAEWRAICGVPPKSDAESPRTIQVAFRLLGRPLGFMARTMQEACRRNYPEWAVIRKDVEAAAVRVAARVDLQAPAPSQRQRRRTRILPIPFVSVRDLKTP